jgi:hypothetical protein
LFTISFLILNLFASSPTKLTSDHTDVQHDVGPAELYRGEGVAMFEEIHQLVIPLVRGVRCDQAYEAPSLAIATRANDPPSGPNSIEKSLAATDARSPHSLHARQSAADFWVDQLSQRSLCPFTPIAETANIWAGEGKKC